MSQFRTIREILDFLKLFNFSDQAIIEVCRQRYFTRRERKVFDHYPSYLQGRTQAEIGYLMGMAQPAVSYIMKRCRTKIRMVKQLMREADYHLSVIERTCTLKAYNVLQEALAGTHLVKIARKRKCTVFNISLICSCALRRLKKVNPGTFNWTYSLLRMTGTIRSTLPLEV